MIRFAEEKDLERVNELRKQVNDVHVNGRPDIFKPGFNASILKIFRSTFFNILFFYIKFYLFVSLVQNL